jgi:hypothetical protein
VTVYHLPRLVLCAAVCVVLFIFFSSVFAPWSDDANLSNMSLRQLAREVVFQYRRQEALKERCRILQRSDEGKRHVADELAEGRLSIADAAEEFHRLNEMLRDGNEELIGTFQTPSNEEARCSQILGFVSDELRDSPDHDRVLERLRGEVQEYLRGQSAIVH